MTEKLAMSLHQVGLTLSTEHEPLRTLGQAYLDPLLSELDGKADIHVTLEWNKALPTESRSGLAQLGRRIWAGRDHLQHTEIHQVPGLQMDIARRDDEWSARATYAWPRRRTGWLAAVMPALERRVLVSLLYYLVYFPYAWHFERSAGWSLLHASALATPEGGLILSGLPGCGKSTASLAALGTMEWKVVSDNLLFTDGHQVFALPEPIHVDARAQALIGDLAQRARPTDRRFSHQRRDFEVAPEARRASAVPTALGFLHVDRDTSVRPVSADRAALRLMASDCLAKEWMAYQESAAAMHQVWPEIGDHQRRQRTIEALTGSIPCYDVTIARDKPIPEAVQQVAQRMLRGG